MQIDSLILGDFETNCYIVRSSEEATDCLIIDPGFGAEELLDFLNENALEPSGILLTHGHCDHLAGVPLLRGRFGDLAVSVGRPDSEMLTGGRANLSALMGFSLVLPPADRLLDAGDTVNLERALAYGGQIGGHLTQGHVDATGEIVIRQPDGDALILGIRTPQSLMRYIVEKGFIAVEGASLTVVSVEEDVFTVSLVEFTQNATTLANLELGAMVNLEVDMIAKYVERMLEERHIVPATESERG